MQEPIDRSRPLWHFYVIDGYHGGSVVVSRFHHALADGIALAEVLLSLTDAEPDDDLLPVERHHDAAVADEPEPPPTSLLEVAGRFARPAHRPGVGGPAWRAAPCSARSRPRCTRRTPSRRSPPRGRPGQVADKLLLGHNPESPFSEPPGLAKRAVWSQPRPLVDIKLVGRVAGATVNDVLVGAVSAAISQYVADRGGRPGGPVDDGAGQRARPGPAAPPRARQQVRPGDAAAADLAAGAAAAPRRDQAPDGLDQALPRGRAHLRPAHRDRPRQHRRGQAAHRLLRGQGDRGHHQRRRPDDRAATSPGPASPASSAGCPGRARRPWACASSATTASSGSASRPMPARFPTPRSSCTPSTTRWTPSSGSPPPSDQEVTMPTDTASSTVVVDAPLEQRARAPARRGGHPRVGARHQGGRGG